MNWIKNHIDRSNNEYVIYAAAYIIILFTSYPE